MEERLFARRSFPTVASRLEKTISRLSPDVLRSGLAYHRDPRSRNLKRPCGLGRCKIMRLSFSSGNGSFGMERPSPRGSSPVMKPSPTPMTFAATANCVLYQAAAPIFGRRKRRYAQPGTGASRETNYSSHTSGSCRRLCGHPADLDAMKRLSASHGLVVIEKMPATPWALTQGPPRRQY